MIPFIPTLVTLVALTAQEPPSPASWQLSERPSSRLGTVEGSAATSFGTVVGASRLASGNVVVADGLNLELKLFQSGTLATTAGGRGDGPTEFQTIKSLRRCTGDSLFVHDAARGRIVVYTPAARQARSLNILQAIPDQTPPYDFFCGTNGTASFVHRSPAPPAGLGPRRPVVAITLLKSDGEVTKIGTFPYSERYFNGHEDFPRPLGKLTTVAIGSGAIYVGTGDYRGTTNIFHIPVYSATGQRLDTIVATLPRKPVTTRHISRFIEDEIPKARLRRGGVVDPRAVRRIYGEYEYPTVFPAYARLLVDAIDNLWVEEYTPPGEPTAPWHVFTKSGEEIARVTMPAAFQLLEAGPDYVLGIWRDANGVEFVDTYRLMK